MRHWKRTYQVGNNICGVRSDDVTFFVKEPRNAEDLDTFLREDCTCTPYKQCDFHQQMFKDERETV